MPGKVLKTLLLEDNPGDAFILQELLEDLTALPVELVIAEQLSEGLAQLRQSPFDLLLLDLSLPDAHGIETVSRVCTAAPDLAIVVLTGLDDEATAIRAMQEGAQDYLVKGKVDSALLSRAIRYALERKRAEENMRRLIREQVARVEAEAAERRYRFLAEASRTLASSLDYQTTLSSVARLAIPTLADYCFVDLVQDGGEARRVAVASVDPVDPLPREEAQVLPRTEGDPVTQVLSTGEGVMLADVPDSTRAALSIPRGWTPLRPRSLISVPLVARERTLGAMTFITGPTGRRYRPVDLALAWELAGRVALAVDNARLYGAREEMLRVVSHDLRTPLTVMRGNIELLRDGDIPQGDALLSFDRATQAMDRLIQDLLDVTRMDAGTLALEPQRVGVATLLEEAEEMLRPAAESRGLELCTAEGQELPFIHADRDRLLQVLWNLVGNAIKFTPAGGTVTLSVKTTPSEALFAVSDTGPGIPEKDLAHVFDRFWQGRKADRRGAGLGLSIAKGIVEAHGGRIWVNSLENQGSTFFFTLPLADAPPHSSSSSDGASSPESDSGVPEASKPARQAS